PVVGNDLPELELNVVDDLVGHGAGGRRHRHPDVHPALAGGESVDEADVDDGHRDLRVVDLVEGGHQWRPKRFVATVRHLVVRLPGISFSHRPCPHRCAHSATAPAGWD